MARCTTTSQAVLPNTFDILDDNGALGLNLNPRLFQRPVVSPGIREVFEELPIHFCQSQSHATKATITGGTGQDPCHSQRRHGQGHDSLGTTINKPKPYVATLPMVESTETRQASRSFRQRRPPIDSETFQPLVAVQEEASTITDDSEVDKKPLLSSNLPRRIQGDVESRDLLKDTTFDGSIQDKIKKHLAGQFEWLISDQPASDSANNDRFHDGHTVGCEASNKIYGCNLLMRKGRSTLPEDVDHGRHSADAYILLATPLKNKAKLLLEMDEPKIVADDGFTARDQASGYPATPLKVPEIAQAVENAVSPSLTVVSDGSCSFGDGSSRTGSFSLPRIEDSLEELDRLEEEIEALNEVTRPRRVHLFDSKRSKNTTPTAIETRKTLDRAPMARLSATVRVKPSEKTGPLLRRSASLTMGDKGRDEPQKMTLNQRPNYSVSRAKVGTAQATTPKPSIKSTKPPTVAKFELPGEAVARRLKEQREARRLQQTEALKPSVAPPKLKVDKPLTKPTFELPGDAISRRKREGQEAKLRAEEEDERKRRELRARPTKQGTTTPSSLPRETIVSRARQVRIQEEGTGEQATPVKKANRLSHVPARAMPNTPTAGQTQQMRGRDALNVPAGGTGRTTSTLTGHGNGKQSSVYAEEVGQQQLRGRGLYTRANNILETKERERRETARTAREQAAERSRIASRGWAEKKRRKEAALRGQA